ncbi:hypothetical protein BJX68DRAFT_257170 [Aspergillus pseudodeflectus]|uniref:Alpha/beta hydrolase fold-3 domain-containing protein n=1 Tax=Aspergillus pseudodeflectus TaxID=176178 RepID=A0ABR4JW02_9EURO
MNTTEGQVKAILAFRKGFKSCRPSRSVKDHMKAPIFISKIETPTPDPTVDKALRDWLWSLYKGKSGGLEKLDPPLPSVIDKDALQPSVNDHEAFKAIQTSSTSDETLLYLSGRRMFRADPPGVRPLHTQLCKRSGSRVFTFQPREADFRRGIGAAILHLHLLQVIQSLNRSTGPTRRFNCRDVPAVMPKGCVFISPGSGLALSLPSVKKFESFEWDDLHCDNSALCHPLIDPSIWTDWTGMSPMWIAAGEETYADGIGFLVKNIKASGVPVTFVRYQTMPHIWNVVMPFLPQSQHVTKLWGEACRRLAESRTQTSAAYFVTLGALKMLPADSTNLLDLPDDELLRSMQAARDRLAKNVWKGPEKLDCPSTLHHF